MKPPADTIEPLVETSRIDQLADDIVAYTDQEGAEVEIRYYIGAVAESPVCIGISSAFAELYLLEDVRRDGWLVVRYKPSHGIRFRRLAPGSAQFDAFSEAVDALGGERQDSELRSSLH